MKHIGDITKLNGAEIPPAWCVVGGSPCQDLSVAGKRAGLVGQRSGLYMHQVRVVKEMRRNDKRLGRSADMVRPRYLVWENVVGAYSSNFKDGFGDFGAVLEEAIRVEQPDYTLPRLPNKYKWTKAGCIDLDWGQVAWRTHDAQYFGVAQRRRRICLVVDYNGHSAVDIVAELVGEADKPGNREAVSDTGDERRSEVLPLSKGLSGNHQSCEPTREGTQAYTADGAEEHDRVAAYGFCPKASAGAGSVGLQEEIAATLTSVEPIAWDGSQTSPTLTANNAGGNQRMPDKSNFNCVVEPVPYTLKMRGGVERDVNGRAAGKGPLVQTDISATLGVSQDHTVFQPISLETYHLTEDVNRASILKARDYKDPQCVIEPIIYDMTHANEVVRECGETCPTLQSRMGTGGNQVPITVEHKMRWIVRRLTPTECERLQGFPDGWTGDIYWKDAKGRIKKSTDSARYKALGNSIAVGYVNGRAGYWCQMFMRMAKYLPMGATLGSLFDGIGGFPLAWEAIHGKGTALWASEIEEFPIAVTKLRFTEEVPHGTD